MSYDSHIDAKCHFVNDNLTSLEKRENKNPLKVKHVGNPRELRDLSELKTNFWNSPIMGDIQISMICHVNSITCEMINLPRFFLSRFSVQNGRFSTPFDSTIINKDGKWSVVKKWEN